MEELESQGNLRGDIDLHYFHGCTLHQKLSNVHFVCSLLCHNMSIKPCTKIN